MEYSIHALAGLAGVSTRTLRYYDEIRLLKPAGVRPSGYRYYTEAQADRLQQILYYRALGVGLPGIEKILNAESFDRVKAMESHLAALLERRAQLDRLIGTAEKSILAMKGALKMTAKEKFEGFKETLIEKNEAAYGGEIRKNYGDEAVDASNKHLRGMSEETYREGERLAEEILGTLARAKAEGDPAGETAQKACALHERWLRIYSPAYSREYHRGLGQMYAADERFAAYYEKAGPGCAAFFCAAIEHYCKG